MNKYFIIFLVVFSFIYIWLSDKILDCWKVYKKYIQFFLILLACIIFYKKPDVLKKIILEITQLNKSTKLNHITPILNNIVSQEVVYNKNSTTTNHIRKVTPLQKKLVASNQSWKCGRCLQLLDASYEIDHIIPLYKGGSNENDNLMALCRNCHGKKTIEDSFI